MEPRVGGGAEGLLFRGGGLSRSGGDRRHLHRRARHSREVPLHSMAIAARWRSLARVCGAHATALQEVPEGTRRLVIAGETIPATPPGPATVGVDNPWPGL